MSVKITIENMGTFDIPNTRVSDLIRFLNSLGAADITEASRRPADTNLILG